MAASKTEKKKAKRKVRLKQAKTRKNLAVQRSQRLLLLDEAIWLREMGNYQEALIAVRQLLRQEPENEAALREMLIIGQETRNPNVEFAALEGLDRAGCMPVFVRPMYCGFLLKRQRNEDARRVAEEGLALLPQARISGKRELRRFFNQLITVEARILRPGPEAKPGPHKARVPPAPPVFVAEAKTEPLQPAAPVQPKPPAAVPPVPVVIEMDDAGFAAALQPRAVSLPEDYDLTLQAHQFRLRETFGLDFPSSDDPGFRAMGDGAWGQPFLVASISQAKSKKNYALVTGREYDMVIVDEAHHLKNRNTLNWKLVNDLQKRFLLLLTATPVENNLMELFNLITLLKPGQLKTAGEFRREFMTRGDPTDPQNQGRLRELLGEVMIRNTRAVARIDIPPRFAQTLRVEPGAAEQEIYDRITALVQSIHHAATGPKATNRRKASANWPLTWRRAPGRRAWPAAWRRRRAATARTLRCRKSCPNRSERFSGGSRRRPERRSCGKRPGFRKA